VNLTPAAWRAADIGPQTPSEVQSLSFEVDWRTCRPWRKRQRKLCNANPDFRRGAFVKGIESPLQLVRIAVLLRIRPIVTEGEPRPVPVLQVPAKPFPSMKLNMPSSWCRSERTIFWIMSATSWKPATSKFDPRTWPSPQEAPPALPPCRAGSLTLSGRIDEPRRHHNRPAPGSRYLTRPASHRSPPRLHSPSSLLSCKPRARRQ
jgi:hypothetical protein